MKCTLTVAYRHIARKVFVLPRHCLKHYGTVISLIIGHLIPHILKKRNIKICENTQNNCKGTSLIAHRNGANF
jgi:hypothetical protein